MSLADPRLGDIEDDASSTKRRSLLAIAGSLLAEISIPKLITAWILLIALPAVLLGLAPLIVSGWLEALSRKVTGPLNGLWPIALLVLVVALGWIGGKPLIRAAEQGFWSLNSLAVQPGYAFWREGAAAPRGAHLRVTDRHGGACEAARGLGGWRGYHRVCRRSPGRCAGVAEIALDRRSRRPGLASPAGHAGACQRRRDRERVPRGRRARLGHRRRDDASAPRPRHVRSCPRPLAGRGASRICPICIPLASALASASRAGAPARAATSGSAGYWPGSTPSTPRSPSISC